jgi:hypothetical protein
MSVPSKCASYSRVLTALSYVSGRLKKRGGVELVGLPSRSTDMRADKCAVHLSLEESPTSTARNSYRSLSDSESAQRPRY